MSIDPQRIVAVQAGRQGSGVLLARRVVLTAAHVVEGFGARGVQAGVEDGAGWVTCQVLWTGQDAALLLAERSLVLRRLPPLDFGRLSGLSPVKDCFATGYPAMHRDQRGRLCSEQISGTLKPRAGSERGVYALDSDHAPPRSAGSAGAGSPWAGFSGSGVFLDSTLVGLVTADSRPDVWQHARLDVLPLSRLFEDPEFAGHLRTHLPGAAELTVIDENSPDAVFEKAYRESLRKDHGTIKVFGIDLDDDVRTDLNGMELDTAYLSLQAAAPLVDRPGASRPTGNSVVGRVEDLLADRPLTLLRGQAGSGKTTLVQWLAVNCAEQTLPRELATLNLRVPFVLKLRTMHQMELSEPSPDEFLRAGRSILHGAQPMGWAHRVMARGRGLLLVDGVDEIPEDQRQTARHWITRLLAHYPRTVVLVTARPSAIPLGWLSEAGFHELSMRPMEGEDRRRFIECWHLAAARAMRLAHRDDNELESLQGTLLRTLEVSPALSAISDSPLLCAMICALHRNRSGVLPHERMAVYQAALDMLLSRRDEERRVPLALKGGEHRALLQSIAHWLVKEGLVEGRRQDAVNQVSRVQQSFRRTARTLPPEKLYAYVLNRSGLLTATGHESFEFIHRTFQDYLAALEFKEDRSFGHLLEHVDDEQWADVIRLTAGHCERLDRGELLERMLSLADAEPDPERRSAIHLLAGSCLPYSDQVSLEIRDRILSALRPYLGQPRHLHALAAVGSDLVEVLPTAVTHENVVWLPALLGLIRTDEALDALADLADAAPQELLGPIAQQWPAFHATRFADRVLAGKDLSGLTLVINDEAQLRQLDRLARCGRLVFRGLPARLLSEIPPEVAPVALSVLDCPDLVSLDVLRPWPRLEHLQLARCPQLNNLDLPPEHRLTSLGVVHLGSRLPESSLSRALTTQTGLARLGVDDRGLRGLAPELGLPGIASLTVDLTEPDDPDNSTAAELAGHFPRLSRLHLRHASEELDLPWLDLRPLTRLRATLTRIRFTSPTGSAVVEGQALWSRVNSGGTPL